MSEEAYKPGGNGPFSHNWRKDGNINPEQEYTPRDRNIPTIGDLPGF